MGDKQNGLQARLMSQALRKLTATISKTNYYCHIYLPVKGKASGLCLAIPKQTTALETLKIFTLSVRNLGLNFFSAQHPDKDW